jgi:hypothetical protein
MRDPVTDPRPGDRFRLRSGEVVRLDAHFAPSSMFVLVDADGMRHVAKSRRDLVRLLSGAVVAP